MVPKLVLVTGKCAGDLMRCKPHRYVEDLNVITVLDVIKS